jgi:flagellar basal-body rod protein FlgC
MLDAILRIAVSGMNAAAKRVAGAASNIANAQDVSRLESKPPQSEPGDPPVYQPLMVAQSPIVGGGVKASFQPVTPAAVPAPDPQSPLADGSGLVGLPNLDVGQQLVDMRVAQRAFEANLKTVQTAQEMQAQLLKLKS